MVADVEIEPAVRGNQDGVPGHGVVACRVGCEDGEQGCHQHRAAVDPSRRRHWLTNYNGGCRHRKHQRIGSIEREQPQ